MTKKFLISFTILFSFLIAEFLFHHTMRSNFLDKDYRIVSVRVRQILISCLPPDISSDVVLSIKEIVSKLKLLKMDEILLYQALKSLLSRNILICKLDLKYPISYIYQQKIV